MQPSPVLLVYYGVNTMPKVNAMPRKILRGGLEPTTARAPKAAANRTADEQRINRILDVIRSVCSGAWREAIIADTKGELTYPVPGMVLSRCRVLTTGDMVSNNAGEVGTRRWHPAITDRLEDMLDRLEIGQAEKYVHPPAIRYDHGRAGVSEPAYDPRAAQVDHDRVWILRGVKLADWPTVPAFSGRRTVRASWPIMRRFKTASGEWLKDNGKVVQLQDGRASGRDECLGVPDETMVYGSIGA